MFLLQVDIPANDTNPWLWIAALMVPAIGYVFHLYVSTNSGRTTRCETREDGLIKDLSSQTQLMKDQSSINLRLVTLVEGSVELQKLATAKIDQNSTKIDLQERKIDELIRRLEAATTPNSRSSRHAQQ